MLCETNATPETVSTIQNALKAAAYSRGRVGGRADSKTLDAVRSFQRARGLPVDGDRYINITTARTLGVKI